MTTGYLKLICYIQLLLLTAHVANAQTRARKGTAVKFSKETLTKKFIAEGVAVGDINRDGKIDVMAGAYWFEAPGWKQHEIAKADSFIVNGGYSNSFLNFCMDVNQDGWLDIVRIDTPGESAVWYENNKNKPGHWKMHMIYPNVGNESPQFVDVDGDGRLDLLCNDPKTKQIIWVRAPFKKGDTKWEKFVISERKDIPGTHMYTHGLGFGDMNGDGRKDVVIKDGWWEAPADPKQPDWTFHPVALSEECSQMYIQDLDGDGDVDIISASAHNYGIWWHEQVKDEQGNAKWIHHVIHKEFSQSHGLALVDVNGDGHPDLVTGKRFFAHNGHDPGEYEPAVLYWFEFVPGKTPAWIPHEIDNNSGVGLHVVVEDINKDGRPDIITGNKKGVHVFKAL
ncbi:FG-GAP repeat domain-containing protein [Chitinophaga defluvii]|uniref:VCBS repeat-containing protein n=1 Tax=Chitinophaga defluvii TaxID=3163343 RepID=A0ABV2TCK3_9BACT